RFEESRSLVSQWVSLTDASLRCRSTMVFQRRDSEGPGSVLFLCRPARQRSANLAAPRSLPAIPSKEPGRVRQSRLPKNDEHAIHFASQHPDGRLPAPSGSESLRSPSGPRKVIVVRRVTARAEVPTQDCTGIGPV